MSERVSVPCALTIAGSDASAGAGIQADLKTFAAFGVYGLCALTAITAQNTLGVRAVAALAPELVAAQVDAVVEDFAPRYAKTGMLANAEIIATVAECVQRWELRLVVDPVLLSTSGAELLQPAAIELLRTRLLPLAEIVTPNIPEAEALTGQPVTTLAEMREAARLLLQLGPRHVIVKGGHRNADPIDVYFDGTRYLELHTRRVSTVHTHGTGCTFAAALTALLAQGASVEQTVREAKRYVTGALQHAPGLGHGHGPLAHFWQQEATSTQKARKV